MNEAYINNCNDIAELVERFVELSFTSRELMAFSARERNHVLKERRWLEKRLNKLKPDWRKVYNL